MAGAKRARKVGKSLASTVKKTITKGNSNKKGGGGGGGSSSATKSKKSTTLHKFSTVKKSTSSSSSSEATSAKNKEIVVESLLKEIHEEETVADLSGKEDGGDTAEESLDSNDEKLPTEEVTTTTRRNLKRTRKEEDGDDDDNLESENKNKDGNAAVATPSTPKRKKIRQATGLLSPPPSSPSQRAAAFPTILTNYIFIHSNLLTYLLLHYSQKSINTPAIVTTLIPHLARSSRKDVSLEDLRRISSLSDGTITVVHTEQGTGVELVGNSVLAKIDSLRSGFGGRVNGWWEQNKGKVASEGKDDVLGAMELAPIVESKASKGNVSAKSVKKTLLAKGQQRLSELKKFSVLKATSKSSTTTSMTAAEIKEHLLKKENAAPTPKPPAAAARGSSLLERIRAKQAIAAAAPPPPPKEFLQKQSALQSLESIIPILLQLNASAKKTGEKLATSVTSSFPLHVVITHIQNSVRNPISAEDAERAVKLLAGEVAPSWCRVVEWQAAGKKEGKAPVAVVFDTRGKELVEKWKWEEPA